MSDHEVIRPAGWPRPRGYSNGILARPGRILAIAGQIAWDVECRIVSDDFTVQFGKALANLCAVVEAAGGAPRDVLTLTIFVTDRYQYLRCAQDIGKRYKELFGHHYPAMTLVQVAALLDEGAQVEIQGLAVIPDADVDA